MVKSITGREQRSQPAAKPCCRLSDFRPPQLSYLPPPLTRSRPSMTATLQREHWNGQSTYLGDLFRVSKTGRDKTLTAVRSSGRLTFP